MTIKKKIINIDNIGEIPEYETQEEKIIIVTTIVYIAPAQNY